MPGIAPDVISHKLTISSAYKPVRQKRRSYDAERYEAMRTEVEKLQTIGFIREATYPLSVTTDRPARGCHCRPRTAELYGRLLRL
ncbi:hypothetical protein L3X38_022864 [Prunus dulcis]|uniref:Uncharacterized protein n=1 Tax=Prunus dulcis TaxID=3755 RepID=A0AAD4VWS2_PRUDU|nr:hypothetical protein L3X38_022864 [Prunus dulcis]